MNQPEILAPAGNLFKLETAIRYGADAVYLAGQKFGLRSAADNFSISDIERGCTFAHNHHAKVYVVLNGFLFDEDLTDLPDFLKAIEQAGVDAVIVSDLGVMECVKRHSNLAIHLSTQASALSKYAGDFWKSVGVTRMVLGREVSLQQAGVIKQKAGIEVEVFGHGAMCMAFSGNCTISNYTAGRDSNRGGCIQSCRMPYQLSQTLGGDGPSGFWLGSKDLQGIAQMKRFCEAGIDSLKIEGRMKSALYVATTVRAYVQARQAVQQGTLPTLLPKLVRELNTMSHRDYTEANLAEKAGADSIDHAREAPPKHTHDWMGHILEAGPNQTLAVQLRNPLLPGEALELLDPDGSNHLLDTRQLLNLNREPVQKAQPNQVILLPSHPAAAESLMVRKPRHAIHHHLATS